jgi:hypothetical protein
MKVFKFTCGEMIYGISAETEQEAVTYLEEFTDDEITQTEEIPESEWDKPYIEACDLNESVQSFFISIRDAIETGVTQILFTNDFDLIDG